MAEGRAYFQIKPWLIFWPGLVLSIVILSINLIGEAFNIFNHPQFTNPNAGQGAIFSLPDRASGSFGQITSTSVNPRVIQFALKYIF